MNLKGKMLTTQNFDLPIESVLPMGTRGRYIMVNSKYIQDIRLQQKSVITYMAKVLREIPYEDSDIKMLTIYKRHCKITDVTTE